MGRERLASLMIVDSSALVAIILAEPGVETFVDVLVAQTNIFMGAPTYLEASVVLLRRRGHEGTRLLDDLIATYNIQIVALGRHTGEPLLSRATISRTPTSTLPPGRRTVLARNPRVTLNW